MRKLVGGGLTVASVVAGIGFGVWALLLNVAIVNEAAGFWGVVVGFVLLPVTFLAAPWYAGVATGNWVPLMVCYGGGIAAWGLFVAGSAIASDDT